MTRRLDRDACVASDTADPLAWFRARFALPQGTIYLDGNSLGALPAATRARMREVVDEQWGQGLIASWNRAGWVQAPRRVGDKVGRLIGAEPGQVIVADSTSVNVYKLVCAALSMRAGRPVVLTERENFHTDLYVACAAATASGATVRTVARQDIHDALDETVALVLLTHVDYRTGEMHDLAAITEAAHRAGALSGWDLCHSVAAVPLAVDEAGVDLAVGCGYKYLNGGPGAPAFLYARSGLHEQLRNPIPGWFGHAAPFAFEPEYRDAEGVSRLLSGTPPVLQLAALESGVDIWLDADMSLVREKSVALTELFIRLVDTRCAGHDIAVASPREAGRRGSQVSLRHDDAYGIVMALHERGVIGDFRSPDLCRFGFAPLYTRHVDVYDAVEELVEVLESGAFRGARHAVRAAVT